MTSAVNQGLHQFIPKGRINALDILRGLAIIMMTLPHQTLPFNLQSTPIGHQLFIIGAYYTRPVFIAVSGMAIVLYEKKYQWPFRMIAHGCILFAMAWTVDVLTHQSLNVDWDIFQLIGACYAIAGALSYAGDNRKKFLGLFVLLLIWFFIPSIRPDQGLFPIWPNGIYFIGGYLIAKWGLSRFNLVWIVALTLIFCVVYFSIFYIYAPRTIESSTAIFGIMASFSCIFILLCLTLLLENQQLSNKRPLSMILRFGLYPVSLYFMQQFFTVFGIRFNFKLVLTDIPSLNCILQTALLLIGMYFTTYVFNRCKFLSVEFWLRRTEYFIMDIVPARGIFKQLPTNKSALG